MASYLEGALFCAMARHIAGGAAHLTTGKRDGFRRDAGLAERLARTLCIMLADAGCRLSKTLAADQAGLVDWFAISDVEAFDEDVSVQGA